MKKKFLVAVDDSEISMKAVSYVAGLASVLPSIDVNLFHVLPPLPPKLLEHGGAENPREERDRERALASERERWIAEARRKAQPIFDRAKSILGDAGVEEGSIHQLYLPSVHGREVAREALDAARDAGCDTIVVGQRSFSWYQELTKKHVAQDLIDNGEDIVVSVVL